jgi:hypothetical protein
VDSAFGVDHGDISKYASHKRKAEKNRDVAVGAGAGAVGAAGGSAALRRAGINTDARSMGHNTRANFHDTMSRKAAESGNRAGFNGNTGASFRARGQALNDAVKAQGQFKAGRALRPVAAGLGAVAVGAGANSYRHKRKHDKTIRKSDPFEVEKAFGASFKMPKLGQAKPKAKAFGAQTKQYGQGMKSGLTGQQGPRTTGAGQKGQQAGSALAQNKKPIAGGIIGGGTVGLTGGVYANRKQNANKPKVPGWNRA